MIVYNSKDEDMANEFVQLDAIMADYENIKGSLIPILQDAQNAFGYLSPRILRRIGEKLSIPSSQVYGVVTFYSQFHLAPRGRHVIRVCQGTACHVCGSENVLHKIEENLDINAGETTSDLEFTLETVACVGACGLAPVLMVNDDTHGRLTPEAVPEVVAQYQK